MPAVTLHNKKDKKNFQIRCRSIAKKKKTKHNKNNENKQNEKRMRRNNCFWLLNMQFSGILVVIA